jgi:hypothetical protein
MPRLAPQVQQVSRIRGRHVLLGGAIVAWATVALAQQVGETAHPKRAFTRAAEERFLDGLELRSVQDCPQADQHDAWGDSYQVLCQQDAGMLQVVIVSYGDGDAIVSHRSYPR